MIAYIYIKYKNEDDYKMNINISFLGLGVVGSKLMEYIRNSLKKINDTYDVRLTIGPVYVRDAAKKRGCDTSGLTLTNDPYAAVREADIVIECMGGNGTELTHELMSTAIQERRSVIMSSKKCLALYGKDLAQTAEANKVSLRYEATVGGCIPLNSTFENMGRCETVNRIYGICNATSNFILGEMTQGVGYQSALQKAVELGIAENNPAEDVDGWDTLYKTVIMAGFGMKYWLDYRSIAPVSIRSLTKHDFEDAERQNSVIKPFFSIELCEDGIQCRIGPEAVPKDTILASVGANNNVIVIESSESGKRAFIGQGAGARPTASAMYDDLIKTITVR
jgi:homoserine dehydrogenase